MNGQNGQLESIQAIAASISALAATIAVVMAGWTVLEARRLREVQSSPEVIVYLEMVIGHTVELVIRNIGTAPAYLVKFTILGSPIPFGFFRQEDVFAIRNGINLLPPGNQLRYVLNSYADLPSDEVTIDVCYFAKGETDRRSCRRESFTLRPLEFEKTNGLPNRERDAQIAIKKGWDALREGKVTITVQPKRGRI